MKIVCIGGGPAGLYFGLLMKMRHPAHEIVVVERNRPYDTFGWGVVFSDATMDNMRQWDPQTAHEIQQAFNHWDDIELHFKGRVIRSGGHGFVGIGRKMLLNILQARCEALGVELRFETDVAGDEDFPDADLVVASDGINSRVRTQYAEVFKPDIVTRPNRYIWLGTKRLYDAFTFLFEKTEHGWFQAHIYKFDDTTSTFIVECPEQVWKAHGLDQADPQQSIDFCEKLFADNLQGERLMSNARHLRGSAWLNFQRVKCERWWLHNGRQSVVLMLARYQALREVDVLRLQNAAWNAMEWFEVVGRRYADTLPPEQFMYSMLTRSQRISHENLRLRDARWLEGFERWFARGAGLDVPDGVRPPPPMFTPYTVRGVTLKNRVVVSPMAQYSAVDGVPGDFHLMHLGARALGGAGLVFAEMTCVSAEGRITPGCPGLYTREQVRAWKRIADFIHTYSDAKFGIQIGHSGAKGSTNAPWDGAGADHPLAGGNWDIVSASPQQYLDGVSAISRGMARADMDRVTGEFVRAAEGAAEAGADWLELHCAHGYLLSSFISPLTNRRDDEYGGSLANRLRYPLEVFRAVRAAWPQH
ncbi:MAG: FAD-dependent monooxygenase, partial [Burkholderiaceae bacterium]|nr:FAD-dependent monooxygenase [Burkholderiaceae bacterium]